MDSLLVNEAQNNFFTLLDRIARDYQPIQLADKVTSGIFVGEEDWKSIQDALCFFSIPGMGK